MDTKTNFSCAMDPDEAKILRIKRADMGVSWEQFMHYMVEIIKPIQDLEELINVKNNIQELKKKCSMNG